MSFCFAVCFLLLGIGLLRQVNSLDCYVCDSQTNNTCAGNPVWLCNGYFSLNSKVTGTLKDSICILIGILRSPWCKRWTLTPSVYVFYKACVRNLWVAYTAYNHSLKTYLTFRLGPGLFLCGYPWVRSTWKWKWRKYSLYVSIVLQLW